MGAHAQDSSNSMDKFADELVAKLADKLIDRILILDDADQDEYDARSLPDQRDEDEEEESMLRLVLGLRGGAKAMKSATPMKSAPPVKSASPMKSAPPMKAMKAAMKK